MTLLPAGVKVHLALGYVDMRKGIDGLAMLVQEALMDGNCALANKRHRAGFTSVKS